MAVNRRWVKTDGTRIEYAPTWLKTDAGLVINPTDEQYRAAGWLQNAVSAPETRDGYVARLSGYEARDGRVVAAYEFAPIPTQPPPPPRIFSKLYLILALQKRGLYDQFKEMIFAAGLGDLWLAANELNDGFDGFGAYVAQAKAVLGLTDAQVEEILGEAVAR